MTCNCSASFQADLSESTNESLIVLWAQQFVGAHSSCGFMRPISTDKPETHHVIDWDADVKYKERGKKEIE